ncbi:hypothetical protein GCM10009001_08960 [Virgibacillus siamensis]|uniref:Uncharacterized protein n=1 Tax=Virgibacillus siamensis TaxID=480071 RepID=A0ABP3QPY6_9BACI
MNEAIISYVNIYAAFPFYNKANLSLAQFLAKLHIVTLMKQMTFLVIKNEIPSVYLTSY